MVTKALNERSRLDALRRYRILDTPAESCFDDITRLASELCATPMSLITLLDESRQWFKSKQGLEIQETPREIAFCNTAIQGDALFEVCNAKQDSRFKENPLVTGEPNITHYAGVPLQTPEGFNIGTLCVLDTQAGQLTDPQKVALEALARQVVLHLELKRALHESETIRSRLVSESGKRQAVEAEIRELNSDLERRVQERTMALENALVALKTSERRFRSMFEDTSIGIGLGSLDGYLIAVNKSYCQMLGRSESDLVGKHLRELTFSDDLPVLETFRVQVLAGEKPGYTMEIRYRLPDGTPVWTSTSVAVVKDESGNPEYTIALLQNVADQKRAESERDRFFNHAVDMFAIIGFEGKVIRVNPAAERILGIEKKELRSLNFFDLLHQDDIAVAKESITKLFDGHQNDLPSLDLRLRTRDDTYILVRFSGVPWVEEKRFFIVGRDISKARQAELALQNLTFRLQRIREDERKRISREIHDELGQLLTALKIDLNLLATDLKTSGQYPNENVTTAFGLVDEALASVKRIAQELRPEILDALGLGPAIAWQVSELQDRTGLSVSLSMPEALPELQEEMHIQVFRILQEALTNIMRHANAKNIEVIVQSSPNNLHLQVKDDGCGFDFRAHEVSSLGLLGMRERARQVNATLKIQSEPGAGTQVSLVIPIGAHEVKSEFSLDQLRE